MIDVGKLTHACRWHGNQAARARPAKGIGRLEVHAGGGTDGMLWEAFMVREWERVFLMLPAG
jgi:hypothetical protein